MARLGPLFDPKEPPPPPKKKSLCGCLFCLRPFPGNEAHKLLLGAHNGVFWVGAKKCMLNKFIYMLFQSPKIVGSLESFRRGKAA